MTRSRRGTARWFTPVVLAAALVATGCGGEVGGGAQEAPTSITIAIEQTVATMDGLVGNSAPVNQIIGAALVRVAPDGSAAPDLAESWTSNADATVWTFTLKPDLVFSDGTPLTAEDVVFSYRTVQENEESLQRSYIGPLQSVEAQGPTTVVFTLNAPNATWPRIVTNLAIAPEESYDPATFATQPIGAGPYTVVSFNGTDTMTVAANPNYHGDPPAIPEATVQYVADETTRLNGLQSGQFDVALLAGNNVTVAESAGLAVESVTGSKVIYLGYDAGSGPMANEKLRQAIGYAVDRAALVDTILLGYGEPVNQMVSSTTFGYDPAAPVPARDVERARQLVAESGYAGEPVPLRYPTGYVPAPADLSQAVANYLTEIGITVTLEPQDASAFLTDWAENNLGALWLFSAQTVTLEGAGTFRFVDQQLHTAADPTMPTLYDTMVGQGDDAQRLATMAEMNRIRTERAYYTPLFVQNFVYVHDPAFTLATPPANGYPNPAFFTVG